MAMARQVQIGASHSVEMTWVVEMVSTNWAEDAHCSSILAHAKCTLFVYYQWSKIGGENDPE